MTYIDGKLVEDLTPDYLNYAMDGDPPLACAVEIVHSPAELIAGGEGEALSDPRGRRQAGRLAGGPAIRPHVWPAERQSLERPADQVLGRHRNGC